ncbi:MAG TPA: amino acid adenylation domain-containing protein, partial [Thermoanaerobaculia bacterium]|nr:amino acid adenylation domain-containing protein [Thermoanaerobaculia bacterium]
LEHWRRELAGAPASLELPADRPRPAVPSFRGGRRTAVLPAAVGEAVRALAARAGATSFMTLLAAFAALLGRWSGQDDLLIGTPAANRRRPELERLIGFFVNTLVLRADLGGDPTFAALLGRVRARALAAYAHEDLPFERLVEALRPERDRSRNPLVQVVLSVDEETAGRGLGRSEELDTGTAKFDLLVEARLRPEGIRLAAEYSADLFEAATVDRLLAGYRRLLEGAVADPALPLSALPLLGAAERHQVLVEWRRRPAPEAALLATIWERFEARARRHPDAVAVVAGAGHLSYGELRRRAHRLAGELRRRGVGPETPVALALERSAELVVAILGTLEAGGCYLPLDPSDPEERIAFMVADVAAPVVVTTAERAARLPAGIAGAWVVLVDREVGGAREADSAPGGPEARQAVGPEGAAYVMYTSGSTGKPKGVIVPHRAVVRLVHGLDRGWGFARFAPDETFLQLAPAAFDASTLELWGALLHGGRLVVAPPGPVSSAELGRAVEAERVTTLWLTAGLFHQVVEAGLERFAGLRRLLAGGDVLSPEHCRRTLAALPDTVLVNGYGPTENTTFTCCHVMTGPGGVASPVPLGRPIGHTAVHVVDRHLRPVPPGVPGELLAGGAGLARGYAGRPARTAERFVPDPFAGAAGSGPGARLYRTGDLARWRPGGELEFLGRLDQQVKIRGFRVEPGEIEAVLAGHPAVAEAVVAARDDPAGGKRLVAYAVASGAGGELAAELRSYLAARLPGPMVPAAVVLLDALPLGPTGKVDRRALPEPRWEGPGEGAGGGPPAGPVEEVIAGAWVEVLGLEPGRIGRHDRFFDLGGHSLAAARVVARMRDALGVELPLAAVFDAPTVAGLAARAERELAGGAAVLPPIERRARAAGGPAGRSFPLSFAQERLWFLDRYEPGSPVYNVPMVLALAGPLDAPALGASLGAIVRRHEVLRTTYEPGSDGPRQVVHPEAGAGLPVVDLSGLPAPARERAAESAAAVLARRPFDLARGPVLRAALLRLGEREHRLALVVHHIATDGWSMGVLLDELAAGYPAGARIGAAGEPSPLPELPVQYADFVRWQRGWLRGELLAEQLAYWTARLADLEPLELPADRPRPAIQSTRGALRSRPLEAGAAAAAEAAGRRSGATAFMTLLAVFAALVARLTGRDDLAFGTPVANRRRSELEGLIGFFVNTLVLRIDLAGDPSFRELLARVRRAALEAYRHQDVPFERLVEALGVPRDLARNPLFQVTFAVHPDAGPCPLGALEVRSLPVASGTAKVDLSLTVARAGGRLEAAAEYASALFDATSVERLLRAFASLLQGAAGAPDARLSELPLLGAAERHQVLVEWRARPGRALPDRSVHRLVAEWAGLREDAVAVVDRGRHLSYGELERRAEALARALGGLGVRPGSLVGLAMERSAERVVALLGILAAGGAYVPLDPSYPEERLAFLLADVGLRVLVTEASALARLPVDPSRTRVLVTDRLQSVRRADPDRARPEPLLPEVDPGAPAYVLYTSGSTGRPKGVVVPHRGVVRLVHEAEFVEFGSDQTILQFSSLSFDASTIEIWGALTHGGRLLIHPPGPIS